MKHVAEWVAQAMGSPVWRDDALLKLYLYCLSRASHNRCVWRGIQLAVGDMPMSERHAAEELCWSRNKLDRQLKRLQEAGLVRVRRMPQRGLLLHIASLFQEDSATNETGSVMEPKVFHHGASSEATTGSTAEQLCSYKGSLETEMSALLQKRKELYSKSRRTSGEEKEAVKAELSDISGRLKVIRKEVRLCEGISARSNILKEKLQTIRADEHEQQRKELMKNEYRRRCGGTNRENEFRGI